MAKRMGIMMTKQVKRRKVGDLILVQSLIKGSFVGEALRIAIVDFVERNFEKRKP